MQHTVVNRMDKSQLLSEFRTQLESLDRFQAFVEKAKEMAGKFRPEVVQKVVADNGAKINEVVAAVAPLVAEAESRLTELASRRGSVASAVESARLAVEELELRMMIGELDEAGFEAAAAGPKAEIAAVDDKLTEIDLEKDELGALLEAWNAKKPSSAPAARTTFAAPPAPVPAPAPVVEASAADDELLSDLEDEEIDPASVDGFEDAGGRGDGVHAELRTGIADDVSAVFDDEASVGSDAGGIAFGDDELKDLGGTTTVSTPSEPTKVSGKAVLILGEGTPDEVVHHFTGEVISLGRGRDNTIQVKNDSKVSRYHCKVFQRDGQFFVEDNKSANGTLVDGELITEKRLVGGEELIVGESFFRFRFR